MNRVFAVFFATLAVSSLIGGIWHGVFSDRSTVAARWVWFATMAALAFAAMALWFAAALLSPSHRWSNLIRRTAWIQLVFQLSVAAFVSDAFGVSAFAILPAVLLVTGLYSVRFHMTHDKRLLAGLMGFFLSIISGLVIAYDYSVHPQWASTNAIYHSLQFVAFGLVFASIPALSLQTR